MRRWTEKRMRHLGVRRPLTWLVAVALGVVATLTTATPAHAADTCSLRMTVTDQYIHDDVITSFVDVTITNTGTAVAKNWFVMMAWSSGVTVGYYFGVTRSTFSASIYFAVEWNKSLSAN